MKQRKTKISMAVTAALLAPLAAHPQTTPVVQRIEITGSNIKRIDSETESPVQVIRREDILRSGASSIHELLDTLTSTTGSLSDEGGSSSFASGASSVSLRNMGKQSTLVLLNSRRIAPYALADFNEVFTNIDNLPIDAIDRIEILKSGASAIYGSDAVAGVINVITRRDYQGLEAGGDYQRSLTSHSFGEGTFHVSGGLGDFDKDRYNVLANVEYFKRDEVTWREVLPYVSYNTSQIIPKGNAQFSSYSFPGNVNGQALPGCDPSMLLPNSSGGSVCKYDKYTRFEAVPAAERVNLLVSSRLKLGETTEGFAELLYAHTKTSYLSAFELNSTNGSVIWSDPSTGATKEFFQPGTLPAGHPLNSTGADVPFTYRFLDAPSSGSTATSDNYRLQAGVRGSTERFEWESAIGLLGAKTDSVEQGEFSDSGYAAVIGHPGDADYFNKTGGYKIGGPNSADVLNRLFPNYGYTGKTTQVAWDGKVSGEAMELPAGPLGYAAGFDVRREHFTISPSDNLLAGDIVGYGVSTADSSRTFGAVFGELNVPLSKMVETQVAARLDKFPGFAAHLSPKLGVRFQPMKELMFRSTIEGGFRAPNLIESAESTKVSFNTGINDPLRCPQAHALANDLNATGNDADALRAELIVQNECSGGVAKKTANNPGLKPEVSRSFTLGMVVSPDKTWNLSLDYWNIERRDEIGVKSTQELLSAEGSLPPGLSIERGTLANDPTFTAAEQSKYGVTAGALRMVTVQFENVSRTKTDGVDLGVEGLVPTPVGKLNLGLQLTYLHGLYAYSTLRNSYGDNLAGRYGESRVVAKLNAALTTGPFINSLTYTYRDGYALQNDYDDIGWTEAGCAAQGIDASQCKVGAYHRFDYYVAYKGIKNLTLGAFVGNVFNQMPAFDIRALNESGSGVVPQQTEEAQRRTLKLMLNYKFF